MVREYQKYEYITVTVRQDLLATCRKSYEAFGWEMMKKGPVTEMMTLRMRRNRDVKRRDEIMRHQRAMEDALIAIERYVAIRDSVPMAVALAMGILGAAGIAGAVFFWLGGAFVPAVFLGLAGAVVCGVNPFVHSWNKRRHQGDFAREINEEYEKLEAACRLGREILAEAV